MALGGRELRVILTSDVDKFRRGLRSAEADAKGFGARMKGIGKAAAIGLAGAAAAAGALAIKFGEDGVKAFLDDEAAAKKLAQTLKNLGKAQDTAKVEDYIDKLSKATGVADDDLRPALEKLIGATGDTDTAMQLLSGSVDTSAGSGKDLAAVADAIAKAVGPKGTLGALRRLIPGLDTTATKAGDAESVMKALNARFGGQSAARMETYGGKVAAVGTAFNELEESFGRGLLENLDGVNDSIGGLDDALYNLQPTAESIGAWFADLATVAAAVGNLTTKFQELKDAIPVKPEWIDTALRALPFVGAIPQAANMLEQQAADSRPKPPSAGGAYPQWTTGYDPAKHLRDEMSKTNVDPSRYLTQQTHSTNRADARSAQRSARTNARP